MNSTLKQELSDKITLLNELGYAVAFVVTGHNGSGKTTIAKRLLSDLPFYQTFNLGVVTKTLRYTQQTLTVTPLENFKDPDVNTEFTEIIRFAISEYQINGVNLVVDGVQVDTQALSQDSNIIGGVILEVDSAELYRRNDSPATHFNRRLSITHPSDNLTYTKTNHFKPIANNGSIEETYDRVTKHLSNLLDQALVKKRLNHELQSPKSHRAQPTTKKP